jgi:CBS domain-containing protein
MLVERKPAATTRTRHPFDPGSAPNPFMKTAVIRHRVADFLKSHAPFDEISEEDLLDLAGGGRVKFHESDEYVFQQGDSKGQFIWVIQQGRVELIDQRDSGELLHDVLGEGDLLGLERFAGNGSCPWSARTATDVILYGVAASAFESLIGRYPALKRFLSARVSVSAIRGFGKISWLDAPVPPMDFLQARLVTIPADASIAEATLLAIGARNGVAALVDEMNRPIGIIGTAELCAAGTGSVRAAARPCPPVLAAPLTTRAVVREMLRAGTEEVVITADGTPDSPLEAILTASELSLFSGCNPVHLVRSMRRAESTEEMKPMVGLASRLVLDGLAQPLDIDYCSRIGSEIIAALAGACIRSATTQVVSNGIKPPRAACCWVMFGASARGELLMPALPSIAAIYDDSGSSEEAFRPEDNIYFAAVAAEIPGWFRACGLASGDLLWPEGSHSSMPLSEWRRLYNETIRDPLSHHLYQRREFFDVWLLSGAVCILEKLQEEASIELSGGEMAIRLLAIDTLASLPPLTFFRGLVLELDGAQHDSFDIISAAVAPLSDAARVFAIAKGHVKIANTLERLEMASRDFPQHAPIFREAGDAFRIALYYRALAGNSRIDPGKLSRFDQVLLKTAFSAIHRLIELTSATFVRAT